MSETTVTTHTHPCTIPPPVSPWTDMTPLHQQYPEQARKAFLNPDTYRELHSYLKLGSLGEQGFEQAFKTQDPLAVAACIRDYIEERILLKGQVLTEEDVFAAVTERIKEFEKLEFLRFDGPTVITIRVT